MTEEIKKQILELRKNGIGYKAIATSLDMSRDSVRSFCKRNELIGEAKLVAVNIEEKIKNNEICSNCSKPLKLKTRGTRSKRFCSDVCRRKWWKDNPQERVQSESAIYEYVCPHCGREFSCYGNKKRKFCSHNCFIKSTYWGEEDGV